MSPAQRQRRTVLDRRFRVSAYDIPTQDKLPTLCDWLDAKAEGLALDIGSGTGYTTAALFGDRPTICVDCHAPNLQYYRSRMAAVNGAREPWCVIAKASQLPFRSGTFRFILCSEVLEHLEEDEAAVAEMARVMADDAQAMITVPYSGLGFTGFLELLRIKTVHDFPGPERHVRPGYDVRSLARLLAAHGLVLERHTFYLRFFTKLVTDGVSLAHLLYQRLIHGRRAWNWSEAASAEGGLAFRLYTWAFPLLWAVARLDGLLARRRGFGLIARVRKQAESQR